MSTPPYSPGHDDQQSRAPLGPEADPGYLPSLSGGYQLGLLRKLTVAWLLAPLFLVLVAFYVLEPFEGLSPLSLSMPVAGALAAILAAVLPRVAPVPPEPSPDRAARSSTQRFQQATIVKLALCELPLLLGFVSGFVYVGAGVVPVAVGAAITYLASFALAVPTRAAVERFRSRLESAGGRSYLWNGLLAKRQETHP